MHERQKWTEIAKRFSELTEAELESEKTRWVRGCDENHALLIAIDQKRQKAKEEDRDIVRQHHKDILAQNDRHHGEQLAQQHREFQHSKLGLWIATVVSVAAALAGWASVLYSRGPSEADVSALQSSVSALQSQIAGLSSDKSKQELRPEPEPPRKETPAQGALPSEIAGQQSPRTAEAKAEEKPKPKGPEATPK